MTFQTPTAPGPDADESALLLGFIRWQREQVVATAAGLTDEQLRWRPDERLIPIGGIINHLTHMEWRWVEGRYLVRRVPAPNGRVRSRPLRHRSPADRRVLATGGAHRSDHPSSGGPRCALPRRRSGRVRHTPCSGSTAHHAAMGPSSPRRGDGTPRRARRRHSRDARRHEDALVISMLTTCSGGRPLRRSRSAATSGWWLPGGIAAGEAQQPVERCGVVRRPGRSDRTACRHAAHRTTSRRPSPLRSRVPGAHRAARSPRRCPTRGRPVRRGRRDRRPQRASRCPRRRWTRSQACGSRHASANASRSREIRSRQPASRFAPLGWRGWRGSTLGLLAGGGSEPHGEDSEVVDQVTDARLGTWRRRARAVRQRPR